MNNSEVKRASKGGIRKHWVEFTLAIGAILVIHAFLYAKAYRGAQINAEIAGQFGDFIGGYVGTIILAISVALLVAQLRDQLSTNERTAFESRFFELLRYYRENVSEIDIASEKTGRRVFVSLIREFREALSIVEQSCGEVGSAEKRGTRIDLAYMAFYYGVGPNSTRILREAVSYHNKTLVELVILKMTEKQSEFRKYRANSSDTQSISAVGTSQVAYCPFDGHQSRLGHYYRHLFQLIRYVDDYAPQGAAQQYADILRAQLTNHEQALLCLNSLAKIGERWITLGYMNKYSLIQNIPKAFFDPINELDIKRTFPSITFEFERSDTLNEGPNRTNVS